jgi:hypothetical protein
MISQSIDISSWHTLYVELWSPNVRETDTFWNTWPHLFSTCSVNLNMVTICGTVGFEVTLSFSPDIVDHFTGKTLQR